MSALVFRKFGGSYHVRIRTFDDLVQAVAMHEALWVASSAPTRGLWCDPVFLAKLDADGDQRILPYELRAAVEWTGSMLSDTRAVEKASDVIELGSLSEDAKPLREAAKVILEALGKPKGTEISLAQIRESKASLRAKGIFGEGIAVLETIADTPLRKALAPLVAAIGPKKTSSGAEGVDRDLLDRLKKRRAEAIAHLEAQKEVMAWGEESEPRAKAIVAARARLDEYFLQCRLAAGQPETKEQLRLAEGDVRGTLGDADKLVRAARSLPIAPPRIDGTLRFAELHRGPDYEVILALRDQVTSKVLGQPDVLAEHDWRDLSGKASAILAWIEKRSSDALVALGLPVLTGVDAAGLDALDALIARDAEHKPTIEAIDSLEKLALYQRWLLRFANNMVAMPDLFRPDGGALFERGTLTLAGRHFALTVEVPDRAAHAAIAEPSNTFVAYLEVNAPKKTPSKIDIAVAVTSGTSAGIEVGKRGVFRDRDGAEHDAKIVHIVRQPVSLWEAATAPFSRVGRLVSSRLEAFGQSGDAAMASALESAPGGPPPPPAPGTPAAAPSPLGGVIASGGIAFAAVGSSLAFMISQLESLSLLDIVRAALAILALIMIPSAFLGWLKLRRRNLAVLLEGAGWALNDRIYLDRRLAHFFTRRPVRPEGSEVRRAEPLPDVSHDDEDERARRRRAVLIAMAIAIAAAAYVTRAYWWPYAAQLIPPPPGVEQRAT